MSDVSIDMPMPLPGPIYLSGNSMSFFRLFPIGGWEIGFRDSLSFSLSLANDTSMQPDGIDYIGVEILGESYSIVLTDFWQLQNNFTNSFILELNMIPSDITQIILYTAHESATFEQLILNSIDFVGIPLFWTSFNGQSEIV